MCVKQSRGGLSWAGLCLTQAADGHVQSCLKPPSHDSWADRRARPRGPVEPGVSLPITAAQAPAGLEGHGAPPGPHVTGFHVAAEKGWGPWPLAAALPPPARHRPQAEPPPAPPRLPALGHPGLWLH